MFDVRNKINSLKPGKSPGHGGIQNVACSLCALLNTCIDSYIFPTSMKMVHRWPAYKKLDSIVRTIIVQSTRIIHLQLYIVIYPLRIVNTFMYMYSRHVRVGFSCLFCAKITIFTVGTKFSFQSHISLWNWIYTYRHLLTLFYLGHVMLDNCSLG